MKKIILFSILSSSILLNTTTTIKADGFYNRSKGTIPYSIKQTKKGLQGIKKAIKHTVLATTDLGKGLAGPTIILASIITSIYGLDYALEWATKNNLSSSIFNHYTFGTIHKMIDAKISTMLSSDNIQNIIKKLKGLDLYKINSTTLEAEPLAITKQLKSGELAINNKALKTPLQQCLKDLNSCNNEYSTLADTCYQEHLKNNRMEEKCMDALTVTSVKYKLLENENNECIRSFNQLQHQCTNLYQKYTDLYNYFHHINK